jgi:hypothetical protein
MVPSLWSVNCGYLESHFFGSMQQVDFLVISEQYISFHADCQWAISVFNYDDYYSPKNIMIIISCNITKKKGNRECPLRSMFWASIYLLDELAVVCGNASSAILHYFFEEGISFKCLFVVCTCSFFYFIFSSICHLASQNHVSCSDDDIFLPTLCSWFMQDIAALRGGSVHLVQQVLS